MTKWEIIESDALLALREMPSDSVDAALSDPPYGLGNRSPSPEEILGYINGHRLDTGGDFMGKQWELPAVAVWQELYRVLKPGAYALVFGGTRMFDLLTLGLRLAGFEVRDCLTWLYASGFPKSLNVSKAIDKMRDDDEDAHKVTAFITAARDAAGVSNSDIDAHFGFAGMACHWTTHPTQPCVPTMEQWWELKRLLRMGDEMDEEVTRLNDRKGEAGDAWKNAPIVGEIDQLAPGLPGMRFGGDKTIREPSEQAADWEGYGTALKPSWEPCVLVRKPLAGTVAETALKYGTGGINVDGCRIGTSKSVPASMPKSASASGGFKMGPRPEAEGQDPNVGRWPANLVLSHDERCVRVGTRKARRMVDSGTRSERTASLSAYGDGLNGKGTHDVGETIEAWECVDGCPVAELDRQSGDRPGMSGGGKHAEGYGGGMFGGIDSTSTARGDSGGASRFFATFHAEPEDRPQGRWSANLVLGHAEGCEQVGVRTVKGKQLSAGGLGGYGAHQGAAYKKGTGAIHAGDETVPEWKCVPGCPVAELDKQSGELPAGVAVRHRSGGNTFGGDKAKPPMADIGYGDSGGASRFFYAAKASRAEREFGCEHLPPRAMHSIDDAEVSTQSNRRCAKCGLVKFGAPHCECEEPEWVETEGSKVRNFGPCVKPIKLTKWLATLLLPPRRDGWENEDQSQRAQTAATSPARATSEATLEADSGCSTTSSGSSTADPSPSATTSTTRTKTRRTTGSTTSNASPSSSTSGSTPDASCATESGGSHAVSVATRSPSTPSTGICPQKDGRSTDDAGGATSPSPSRTSVSGGSPREPRRILVPFSGTGSEMIGAMRAGWDEVIGIQRIDTEEEKAYVAIARARLERWSQVRSDMDEVEACASGKEERKAADRGQMGLFG